MSADQEETLRRAVHYFSNLKAAKSQIKTTADNAKLTELLDGAQELGLKSRHLPIVASLLYDGLVPRRKFSRVMKCLIPRNSVPLEVVIKLLAWMNTSQVDVSMKKDILKWLSAVIKFVENGERLHAVYFIFFQLLSVDQLRPIAANILLGLTRREDVVKYRVDRLLRLRNKLGNDKHINWLLDDYKQLCSHLVTTTLPHIQKEPQTSSFWSKAIQKLKMRQELVLGSSDAFTNPLTYWQKEDDVSLTVPNQSRKRKRYDDYLPFMKPNPNGDCVVKNPDVVRPMVMLSSISSTEQLASSIDRIKLPAQSLTILRYPILHNVASCCYDPVFVARMNYNLKAILYQDFTATSIYADVNLNIALLSELSRLYETLQEGNPIIDDFLTYYMTHIWNGRDYINYLFPLLTRLRIRELAEMQGIFLSIKKMFVASNISVKIATIEMLHTLLDNYLKREIIREESTFENNGSFFFKDHGGYVNVDVALQDFLHFAEELFNLGLMIEDGNLVLVHAALDFYQQVASLPILHDVALLMLAPKLVIYNAFATMDPFVLDKACRLLWSWEKTVNKFETICEANPQFDVGSRGLNNMEAFTTYVADFDAGLQRNRAFVPSKRPSSVFNMPEQLRQEYGFRRGSVGYVFALTRHPAILLISRRFQTENFPGDLSFLTDIILTNDELLTFRKELNEIGLINIDSFLELRSDHSTSRFI